MSLGLVGILLAAAILLAGAYAAPFFSTHAEQDECSFGPVTNAQYRDLLAEAKRKQKAVWPALVQHNDRAADVLNARFDDLSSGATSVYERLAAMHAVVRAIGGDYRNTNSSYSADPYRDVVKGGTVSINYHVDVNKLGFFSPVGRQMWLIASIVGPNYTPFPRSETRAQRGDIRFIVHFPNILEGYYDIPKSRFQEKCPPVPSLELAQQFTP